MWSLCVVINPPVFDDVAHLGEIAEKVFVEAFVAQPSVDAFVLLHRLLCDSIKVSLAWLQDGINL